MRLKERNYTQSPAFIIILDYLGNIDLKNHNLRQCFNKIL